ncbi:MAG: hypothetical protein AAF940_01800 [Pseudomonadota bacterium]
MARTPTQADAAKSNAAAPGKQAVVIIHGMGEQRPMETLRSFVEAVWRTDPGIYPHGDAPTGDPQTPYPTWSDQDLPVTLDNHAWLAPDTKTGSSELHRMTTGEAEVCVADGDPSVCDAGDGSQCEFGSYRVDFFELYWADIMAGSTLSHLRAWVTGLLLRWPHQVPRDVLAAWIIIWVSLIIFVLVSLVLTPSVLSSLGLMSKETATAIAAALPGWLTSAFDMLRIEIVPPPARDTAYYVCLVVLAGIFLWLARRMRNAAIDNGFLTRRGFHRDHPQRMRRLGSSFLLAFFLFIATAVWLAYSRDTVFSIYWATVISTAILVLAVIVNAFVVPYFGDVARYVQATTDTVSKRAAVRDRGMKLLRALHNVDAKGDPVKAGANDYGRVTLVAHSLGSIIAYDILLQFWAEQGPAKKDLPDNVTDALQALAKKLEDEPEPFREPLKRPDAASLHAFQHEYRALQGKVIEAMAAADHPWLITDFITLGSPLTHAEFLIAHNRGRFEKLIRERLMAMCPPYPFEDGKVAVFYENREGKKRLHHATPFACIRWTNIFDRRNRFVNLLGDMISGPLRENFGDGIVEEDVTIKRRGFIPPFDRFFTHTLYWSTKVDGATTRKFPLGVGDMAVPDDAGNAPTLGDKRLTHVGLLRRALNLNGYVVLQEKRGAKRGKTGRKKTA